VFEALTEGPQNPGRPPAWAAYMALLLLRALMAEAPVQAERVQGGWRSSHPAWGHDGTDVGQPACSRPAATSRRRGVYLRPSRYEDGPYPITRAFLEDGRRHLIGSEPFRSRPAGAQSCMACRTPTCLGSTRLIWSRILSGDWTRVAAGARRRASPIASRGTSPCCSISSTALVKG